MAKKHHEETETSTATAVVEAETPTTTVEAEQPKVKVGDQTTPAAPTTTVDKPKKTRTVTPKGTRTYRILDGVDASKFSGQRGHVIKSLQKLAQEQGAEQYFDIPTVVANIEGYSAKVDITESVAWHLNVMNKEGMAALQVIPPTPAAEPAK